jgi:hypothetical protein
MTENQDESNKPPRSVRGVENRRWQIGIVITLFFGIFSAVMAYLTYERSKAPRASSPATAPPAAPAVDPTAQRHNKGRGRD